MTFSFNCRWTSFTKNYFHAHMVSPWLNGRTKEFPNHTSRVEIPVWTIRLIPEIIRKIYSCARNVSTFVPKLFHDTYLIHWANPQAAWSKRSVCHDFLTLYTKNKPKTRISWKTFGASVRNFFVIPPRIYLPKAVPTVSLPSMPSLTGSTNFSIPGLLANTTTTNMTERVTTAEGRKANTA